VNTDAPGAVAGKEPEVRSGRLVAWTLAWQAGLVSYDDVVDVVQAGGPPHRVTRSGAGGDAPLGRLLIELRGQRPRLVLPAPGDPRGLPGPGPFTDAALAAGEAVLTGASGLVPAAAGAQLTWWLHDIPMVAPEPITVAEVEHELSDAVRDTAVALKDLEVARWRPELAAALEQLRRPAPDDALPPGFPARAHRLLAQADRIDTILRLAALDAPGAAVNAGAATAREQLLRSVGTGVRRARMAAYNAGVQKRAS